MNKKITLESINKCMNWIEEQMLTFDNGYWGIYERIRIDENLRVNWTRPDCNAEVARVIAEYKKITGDGRYDGLYRNVTNWLLKTQDNDELSAWYGTFPFYLIDGSVVETVSGISLYQNDNGKVLIALLDMYKITGALRLLESAVKLADYWAGIQRPEGFFVRKDGGKTQTIPEGPCFVLWLATGLMMCYKATGKEKYRKSADKAFEYVLGLQMKNGRMKTTYEIDKKEDWRPVSSETAIALYALSKSYIESGDAKYLKPLNNAGKYLLSLQDKSGGICNCSDDCPEASLQSNKSLCDLVYTQGFALMGLAEAAKATGQSVYTEGAKKLAEFLTSIQCSGESPLWDGAWRGSFNIDTWQWDGRANQNNPIDEGGMYSVYTGWCAAPIMYGLLLTLQLGE